jgi:hypothetical protein
VYYVSLRKRQASHSFIRLLLHFKITLPEDGLLVATFLAADLAYNKVVLFDIVVLALNFIRQRMSSLTK